LLSAENLFLETEVSMRIFALIAVLLMLASGALAQDRPWQRITDPTAAQLVAGFVAPAPEYSSQFDWGFGDQTTRDVMGATLDHAKSLGVQAAFVEPKAGKSPYLSPGYFDAVKILVEEARKRNMRLWFDDDGGYPSGFCGGKFATDRPDLRMQGLAAPQRIAVTTGQQYSYKMDAATICVLAVNRDTGKAQVLDSSTGSVSWTVPAGNWDIVLPRWQFRSGSTHSANGGSPSLLDYLNPEADKLFAQWTFDGYKQAVGDEMGKTVLGFRGDEPHVSSNMGAFNPWSPGLLDEFQKRKGYDLRPYLATVAAITIGTRGGAAGPELPTPDAQCLGLQAVDYAVVLHKGDWERAKTWQDAHAFNTPAGLMMTLTEHPSGRLPASGSLFSVDNPAPSSRPSRRRRTAGAS